MASFSVGSRQVGEGSLPYFIADIAANHDGSLERAKKLIELAAQAGASAVKFQHFRAKNIVSKKGFEELDQKLSHQESWQKSVYETYDEASLPWNWTSHLALTAKDNGVDFFTAPYDLEAIDFVDEFVPAYKIGSGDITWIEAIEKIGSKGKPIFIATGASSMEDVERAISAIRFKGVPYCLMQCNTNYTGSDQNRSRANIRVLNLFARKFPDAVLGLSDHTKDNLTVLAAISLGANAIEKHFTDDNNRIGPDHGFSLNPISWRAMVEQAVVMHSVLGDGEKRVEDNEIETVIIQRRAMRYNKNLPKGHILNNDDLVALRPCPKNGIPPYELPFLVGKKLLKDVTEDTLVKADDLV
jgi:sialic acid synthase SpsE